MFPLGPMYCNVHSEYADRVCSDSLFDIRRVTVCKATTVRKPPFEGFRGRRRDPDRSVG